MFTFVSTAPANPGKGGAADAEMTPLKENVMVPKMLYFKIWSLLTILSTYFKTIPLFFTRCISTVMQLCANPLLEILVNLGASERVSIDQFYRPCVLSPQVWHKLTNFMFHTQGETLLHLSRENSGLRQLLLAVKGLSPLTETSSNNSQMKLYCHEIAGLFGHWVLNKPSKLLNTCSDVIKSHLDSFCYILIADRHLLTSGDRQLYIFKVKAEKRDNFTSYAYKCGWISLVCHPLTLDTHCFLMSQLCKQWWWCWEWL